MCVHVFEMRPYKMRIRGRFAAAMNQEKEEKKKKTQKKIETKTEKYTQCAL